MELIWIHVRDQLSRSRVEFYIDEDISPKVAETLRKRESALSARTISARRGHPMKINSQKLFPARLPS